MTPNPSPNVPAPTGRALQPMDLDWKFFHRFCSAMGFPLPAGLPEEAVFDKGAEPITAVVAANVGHGIRCRVAVTHRHTDQFRCFIDHQKHSTVLASDSWFRHLSPKVIERKENARRRRR